MTTDADLRGTFFGLTPNRVLDAVEVGGLRSTGRCMALNSLENRVYEVEMDDGRSLVAKFYRPGRWSRETILEEHAFLAELVAAEVPAVAPIDLGAGTLAEIDGILYAAFPKVRGRSMDELSPEHLRRVGRFLGRIHAVGAGRDAPHRPRLTIDRYVKEPLEVLVGGGVVSPGLASRYRDVALRIAEAVAEPLAHAEVHRVHGDLHWGNLLWASDGSPFFLDLDDMMVAPPAQDLWLLAPGDSDEAKERRDSLLEGYEVFRELDRDTLLLCEPLRGLRIIYYSAWIARRWDDPSFPRAFPTFRHDGYWAKEYEELMKIADAL